MTKRIHYGNQKNELRFFAFSLLFTILFPLALWSGALFKGVKLYSIGTLLAVFALLLMIIWHLYIKFTKKLAQQAKFLSDIVLGNLLILASYIFVIFEGVPQNDLYPLVYFVLSLTAAFYPPKASVCVALFASAVELLIFYSGAGPGSTFYSLFLHIGFFALFTSLFAVFTRFEIIRERVRTDKEIHRRLSEMEEEARDFRLVGAVTESEATTKSTERQKKRVLSSVATLHDTLYDILSVINEASKPQTCAIYILSASQQSLKLRECISGKGDVLAEEIPVNEGILAQAVKHKTPLIFDRIKSGANVINYYKNETFVLSLVAVPIVEENSAVRGVVFCDSDKKGHFRQEHISLLDAAARQVIKALSSERLVTALDTEKDHKEKFYRASARFNTALTLSDVFRMLFESAKEIASPDFLGVTLVLEEQGNQHGIIMIDGEGKEKLEGKRFPANNGIVSSVVRTAHPLPHTPFSEMEEKKRIVFYEGEKMPMLGALKVLPLIVKDVAIGTFVVGTKDKDGLPHEELDMLTVIANQSAVSIANAKMYQKMEMMAVTDGLTGLFNHRAFQEKLSEAIARSERSNKTLALMLMDIDHFKKVNDTYGHPMGDEVLRTLAQTLRECIRDIDMAARYGGEEFVVIMEMTDISGAKKMAERIRNEIKKKQFSASQGKFSVTISLGISIYPDDAKDKQDLIDFSDSGLYYAKEHGRDQAVYMREKK